MRQTEIAATNYRELSAVLAARWPALAEPLGKASIAIDGQIYQDPFLEPIEPDSEVHFLPRIEGG